MQTSPLASQPIFRYRTLALSPSYFCDSSCLHCFIPLAERNQDKYDEKIMKMAIDPPPADIRVIALTGGEPFCFPERLFEMIGIIKETGRIVSVATNGLWAADWERGKELLKKARACGLNAISLSLDDYHRPKLGLEAALRIIQLAGQLGLETNITGVGRRAERMIEQVRATAIPDGRTRTLTVFGLENVGQAAGLAPDLTNNSYSRGCLAALIPSVEPDGRVFACCTMQTFQVQNEVLQPGSLEQEKLESILNRSTRDYLMAILVLQGPAGLLNLLGESIPAARDSLSMCSICLDVLNNAAAVDGLRERIAADLALRKDIVGRHMLLDSRYRPELFPGL
jgi:radical SAM family protein